MPDIKVIPIVEDRIEVDEKKVQITLKPINMELLSDDRSLASKLRALHDGGYNIVEYKDKTLKKGFKASKEIAPNTIREVIFGIPK